MNPLKIAIQYALNLYSELTFSGEWLMKLSPLAHSVMMVAAVHGTQPGEYLPEQAFDLFLTQEGAGDALLELYIERLLEEVPHEVDILTQKGFDYISQFNVVLDA